MKEKEPLKAILVWLELEKSKNTKIRDLLKECGIKTFIEDPKTLTSFKDYINGKSSDVINKFYIML